jgi:hypothetical protein
MQLSFGCTPRAFIAVASIAALALLAACPGADDAADPGADTAGGDRDSGTGNSPGVPPWPSRLPGAAIGSGDDTPADAGQTPAVEVEPALCDGDCTSSEQCDAGQQCIRFAEGKKCAPAECTSCQLGCVYDLQTCSFTRCVAEPPPDAPDTCAQLCESDADCGAGQLCKDVFGLGECAPPECAPCEGYCDYNPTTCVFDACYLGGGPTADPFYCGHQF